MASRNYFVDFEDVTNRGNEESMSFADNFHPSNFYIEDLMNEMSVPQYYKLLNKSWASLYAKPSVTVKSQSVQTDPEAPGIPQSWLIVGQDLVDGLYTGLGNLINTLYHNPNGYCRGKMKPETDLYRHKCSRFVDEYCQSTLLPPIKVPEFSFERKINSENFKKDLNSLMETASKLKHILPCVIKLEQEAMSNVAKSENGNLTAAENADKVEVGDLKVFPCTTGAVSTTSVGVQCLIESSSSLNTLLSHTSSSNPKLSNSHSGKLRYSSMLSIPECKVLRKPLTPVAEEVDGGKSSVFPYTTRAGSTYSVEIRCPADSSSSSLLSHTSPRNLSRVSNLQSGELGCSSQMGTRECKVQRKPLVPANRRDACHWKSGNSLNDRNLKSVKSMPGASKVNGENQETNAKENFTKYHGASSNGINFIKRNILALQTPVIRTKSYKFKHASMKI